MEFPENHIPTRVGISSRVYHMEVIKRKAGDIVASATPSRKRTASNPPKFVQAPVKPTTDPQKRVLIETYFPTGSFWISTDVGYCQKR